MFPRKKELLCYGVLRRFDHLACMYVYVQIRTRERACNFRGDVNNARRRLLGGVEGLAAG